MMDLTPKEIEDAIKSPHNTAHVNDDASKAVIVLRPKNSSRVFQMVVQIEEVTEL